MINALIQAVVDEADAKMDKAIEHLGGELAVIRAGRASPAMLEQIRVDYYGTRTPLSQMASLSAPQPDLLLVQPWDRSAVEPIEKAIMQSDLGLNPSNDGALIRIPVPPLSEERRRDLVKAARHRGEETKIAIRNIRRHARDEIKQKQTEENLPEDMRYEGEETLQKLTDDHVQRIEDLLDRKEAEIMEV